MSNNAPAGGSIFHTMLISAVSAAVFAFTIETYSSWREKMKEISQDEIALQQAQQRIAELETLVQAKALNGYFRR